MPTAKQTSRPVVAAKKAAAPRSANAVALLTADHRDVKRLFKAYEKLIKTRAVSIWQIWRASAWRSLPSAWVLRSFS